MTTWPPGRASQMLGNALALSDPTAADDVLATARERLVRVGDDVGVGLVLLAKRRAHTPAATTPAPVATSTRPMRAGPAGA